MFANIEEFGTDGPVIFESVKSEDARGNFSKHVIPTAFFEPITSISFCSSLNSAAYTLRGLHMQLEPSKEAKVVSCQSGAVFDVVVDLRVDSATLGYWSSVKLTPENGKALYIPAGFAHGFQTLEDSSQITYLINGSYSPKDAITVDPFDSSLGIDWPRRNCVISDSDRAGPSLNDVVLRIKSLT